MDNTKPGDLRHVITIEDTEGNAWVYDVEAKCWILSSEDMKVSKYFIHTEDDAQDALLEADALLAEDEYTYTLPSGTHVFKPDTLGYSTYEKQYQH